VIGEPTVLEIYIHDRLRKGTWPEIKDKIEVEMNRGQQKLESRKIFPERCLRPLPPARYRRPRQ